MGNNHPAEATLALALNRGRAAGAVASSTTLMGPGLTKGGNCRATQTELRTIKAAKPDF